MPIPVYKLSFSPQIRFTVYIPVFSVSDQDSYCPLMITKRIVKKDLNSTDCPFYRVPEHGSFITYGTYSERAAVLGDTIEGTFCAWSVMKCFECRRLSEMGVWARVVMLVF